MEENQNPNQNQVQNNNINNEQAQGQYTNMNNAQPQNPNPNFNQYQAPNTNKGKKNTGLIVVIVILVLALIGAGVYGFITITDLQKKVDEKPKAGYEDKEKDDKDDEDDWKKDSKEDEDDKDDKEDDKEDEDNKKKDDDKSNKEDKATSSKDAKESTSSNPLKLGEWGLAAKNVNKYVSEKYADTKTIDVPVRVTKVTRGEEAEKEVKEWFNGQKLYKYQEPKTNMEWAVVDYEVDLSDVKFDESKLGMNTYVNSGVSGLNGGSIKYNNVTYIISTKDITGTEYVKKAGVYKCKFIVTLPIGCKDYLVKLGSSYDKGSEAFFRCE